MAKEISTELAVRPELAAKNVKIIIPESVYRYSAASTEPSTTSKDSSCKGSKNSPLPALVGLLHTMRKQTTEQGDKMLLFAAEHPKKEIPQPATSNIRALLVQTKVREKREDVFSVYWSPADNVKDERRL